MLGDGVIDGDPDLGLGKDSSLRSRKEDAEKANHPDTLKER